MRYNDLFVTGMENCWKSDFLKKNLAGINFCGLDKSKHFVGTNFRDFVRKPRKLVPAKISTINSENKKDFFKACMVTYQIGDWIKAGVHLGKGSEGFEPLPFFKTDQTVPSTKQLIVSI